MGISGYRDKIRRNDGTYKTILPLHEGDTTDYSRRKGKEIAGLKIDEGVTAIRACFAHNELTELVIPDSVTEIAGDTFMYNLLKSLSLPRGLTCIDIRVFAYNRLESLVIPDSVTEIKSAAFYSNRLKDVKLPEGLKFIWNQVFMHNCLTHIEIPDSVTEIWDEAFKSNQLVEVKLPKGLERIDNGAFMNNCLESFEIPNSVISIGDDAFKSNRLRYIKLPKGLEDIAKGLENIGARVFGNNKLERIVLPVSLKWISDTAFKGNPITSITIGANIQGQQNSDDFTPALLPSPTAFGVYGVSFIDSYIYNNTAAGTYEYDQAAKKWDYITL
ncbi:hypothetical protein FACS1894109_18450 [Spirochaetia bacterium]|nr:hypothetical protein FACS1894109_18450 [Spirochaetia bacterium]